MPTLMTNTVTLNEQLFFFFLFWRNCGINYTFALTTPANLAQEMEWAVQHKGEDGLSHSLFKLSLAATLYHLWRERNFRVFQGKKGTPTNVIQKVIDDSGGCRSAWKNIKSSVVNLQICWSRNISPTFSIRKMTF